MIEKEINRGSFKFLVRPDTMDEWVVDEVIGINEYIKPLSLNRHDKVLDIGMNIGVFTITAGRIGAKVVGYEPDKENYDQAVKNIKLNNLNCQTINKGVSAESGETLLYLNEKKNRGNHSTTEFKGRRAVTIEMDGINEILENGDFNKLKVDCEGEEYKILKAIKDYTKIDAIRMEWHRRILGDEKNEKFNEIISLLEKNGFTVIAKRDGKGWTQMITAIKK